MRRQDKILTRFGQDLDSLLKAAKFTTLREYADECGVSYKYISQLRTIEERRPGKLYIDLLRPFVRRQILDLVESMRLSLRHRGTPLSRAEGKELFPEITDGEIIESIAQATRLHEQDDFRPSLMGPSDAEEMTDASTSEKYWRPYRRVFIGRQAELNELHSAFNAALAGHGTIVMVMGEPGIGKTALCGELTKYVTGHGGTSLVGHCYEMESISLPYVAFVDALRPYAIACDPDKLARDLGTGAADVARILPEVRDKIRISAKPPGNPAEEKYRLFQSIADFLGSAALSRPLLLLLEDLHSADLGTLEMLQHMARNLAGKRILLVGSYRDTEVDLTHPLSATMAELRRQPSFGRIRLRGLNIDEVSRMVSSIIGIDAPAGLGEMVFRHTEGNPLFVEEVAHYMVEEGVISRGGELKQKIPSEIGMPGGLRDVIGKRVSGLTVSCNELLSVAAVIGRDFRLDVLQKVAGIPDEQIFDALEEGRKAALIGEYTEPGAVINYRFAHTLFRQSLYEGIIAPRRTKLHRQVARALEELYASQLEEHAAELSEHYSQSSDKKDLAKAVGYAEMAAEQASGAYAYSDAAKLLEHALKAQRALAPSDHEKLCALLTDLCVARAISGEFQHLLDIDAQAAFSAAEIIQDKERATRICGTALWAVASLGAGTALAWITPEATLWVERADRYAEPDTSARAQTDMSKGMIQVSRAVLGEGGNLYEEGFSLLSKALDLARRRGDSEMIWYASLPYFLYGSPLFLFKERLQLAGEIAAMSRDRVSPLSVSVGLMFSGFVFLEVGNRQQAERLWSEHHERMHLTGLPVLIVNSMQINGHIAWLDGHLEDAVKTFRSIQSFGEELDLTLLTSIVAAYGLYRPLINLGQADELYQLVSKVMPYPLMLALCLAHAERMSEVIEILDKHVIENAAFGTVENGFQTAQYVLALEAAVKAEHREAVRLLFDNLIELKIKTTWSLSPTCVSRHLGAGAAMLGRHGEAKEHYNEAIKVCTEMKFRPELALSRLQLAELLLAHYPREKKEALEHLDFAIKEFREMKMNLYLERASRRKEALTA